MIDIRAIGSRLCSSMPYKNGKEQRSAVFYQISRRGLSPEAGTYVSCWMEITPDDNNGLLQTQTATLRAISSNSTLQQVSPPAAV